MKGFVGIVAIVTFFVGASALARPVPGLESNRQGPKCQHVCGAPEPGWSCPPCQFWDPCSPKCGCKAIPGCKV